MKSRRYLSPADRRLIFAIWKDSCAYCGGPAEHVDHLFPWSMGGADQLHNFAASCAACNSAKGVKTPSQLGRQELIISAVGYALCVRRIATDERPERHGDLLPWVPRELILSASRCLTVEQNDVEYIYSTITSVAGTLRPTLRWRGGLVVGVDLLDTDVRDDAPTTGGTWGHAQSADLTTGFSASA